MSNAATPLDTPTDRWPIRVWPGVLLVLAVAVLLVVPSYIVTRSTLHFASFMVGPVLGVIGGVVWWARYSRATGADRWLVPALFLLPAIGFSIPFAVKRQPPMGPIVYALPAVLAVWVLWLAFTVPVEKSVRRNGLLLVIIAAWALFGMVRITGTDVGLVPELTWAWNPRAEDVAANELNRTELVKATPVAEAKATDWAEFRGPNRDSVVRGVSLDLNWAVGSPRQVWKQTIGPGWGTFAVVGDRLFTQEQRGDDEAVVCYDAATGGQIWRHFERVKFEEMISSVGPRATPTVTGGKVYALGATGLLVCLNADDGQLVWKTDITADTGGKVPQWGYSSSPLVWKDLVITFTGGPDGKGTTAFAAADGSLKWSSGKAVNSYSSAHLTKIAGLEQVVLVSGFGAEGFDPATGKVLWECDWKLPGMNRVCQPTFVADGEFLLGTGVGGEQGTRRVRVTKDGDGWKAEQVWQTRKLKPYFNDGVVHDGHYYGFDDSRFVCIDVKDGSLKWNAGGVYGHGQVLLLADQGLLLVLAIDGKVAVVKATPDDHTEVTKFQAISGKTWNHPVVANGKLFVRNGIEAACYELKVR